MPVAAFLAPVLMELAKNGLGMLAGAIQAKGKEAIEEKLGVKIPDKVEQLTPELLQQLQIKQMDHEEFLVNAQLEETKLYLEDTQSARQRDVELAKAGYVNRRANYLASGTGVLIVVILFMVVWGSNMDDFEKSIITLILGRALGYIDQVFNFEFGTTRSSKQKDDTISKLTNGHK